MVAEERRRDATVRSGAFRAVGLIPWASVLPRRDEEDLARRRRVTPVLEDLRGWGARWMHILPAAIEPWWPFENPEEFGLRLELMDPTSGKRDLDVRHSPLKIGRGDACHVQLPSPTVSTEHAEIWFDQATCWIRDLRSTNGTRRNGQVLEPMAQVALQVGDQLDIGPYRITYCEQIKDRGTPPPIIAQGAPLRPLVGVHPFRVFGHPSDRWTRVLWAGHSLWMRVPALWIRATWQRLAEVPLDQPWETGAMEEGIAQFVLLQVAAAATDALKTPVQVAGWMTGADAEAAAPEGVEWLCADAWIGRPPVEVATSILVPIAEQSFETSPIDLDDVALPASVCSGLIRLKIADWATVEAGDALVPDIWLPVSWASAGPQEGDFGPSYVKCGGFWHSGRLRRDGAQLTLTLETLWAQTPGGDFLVAEKENPIPESEKLPIENLEMQVVVEIDRVTVTLGEMKRWQAGHCISLQRGPDDPVRLVVETGMQRRVLAEGRVVVVNGKLGIEIARILTHLQQEQK